MAAKPVLRLSPSASIVPSPAHVRRVYPYHLVIKRIDDARAALADEGRRLAVADHSFFDGRFDLAQRLVARSLQAGQIVAAPHVEQIAELFLVEIWHAAL